MTSLTPNEDRARAMIADIRRLNAEDGDEMNTSERICDHVTAELMLAQARELDRGTPQDEVAAATAETIGAMAANLADGLGRDVVRNLASVFGRAHQTAIARLIRTAASPFKLHIDTSKGGHA